MATNFHFSHLVINYVKLRDCLTCIVIIIEQFGERDLTHKKGIIQSFTVLDSLEWRSIISNYYISIFCSTPDDQNFLKVTS